MFVISRSNYVFVVDDKSRLAALTALMSGTVPISNVVHCWPPLMCTRVGSC